MTLAKFVSASLSVTVRLVMSEARLACTAWLLTNTQRRTVTSECTAAPRAGIAFVAGVEVLK
jgi:hypothetical protein